jgi:hypothetical protein
MISASKFESTAEYQYIFYLQEDRRDGYSLGTSVTSLMLLGAGRVPKPMECSVSSIK